MPALERADIEASLKKKGFTEHDGDHRYFRLIVGGRYTGIMTKTSRGKKYKTLSEGLVAAMARQLKSSTKEFVELVSCALSRDEYLRLLEQREDL